MSADEKPAAPALRVVRGEPTPEELAALVVVLSASGGAAEEPPPTHPSQWSTPERLVRRPVIPGGVGNWWASGLPR